MQKYEPEVNLAAGSTRARLLDALTEGPADLDALARRLEIHRTVAHGNLRRLLAAGFVQVTSKTSVRGRPRHEYRLADDAVEMAWPARQHRLLAAVLGGALLSHAANPGRAAKQAGLECGRALQIAELEDLVRMGWRYHTENDSLVCDSCAFREACRQSEGIACHVHAGLLQVALHRTVKPSSHSEAGCRFLLGHPPTAAN